MPRRSSIVDVMPSILILSAFLLAAGCSDDSAPRSTATIESINNNEILDSDVYNNGSDDQRGTDDDFIVEDQVSIVVRNRPHDVGLNLRANGPYGAVVFDRYEIRFNGDESLPPLFGGLHLRVVTGATATGEVTVIPAGYKVVAPLLALNDGGEIRVNAQLTLRGKEEDSGEEVVATAVLPVHCANWGDR